MNVQCSATPAFVQAFYGKVLPCAGSAANARRRSGQSVGASVQRRRGWQARRGVLAGGRVRARASMHHLQRCRAASPGTETSHSFPLAAGAAAGPEWQVVQVVPRPALSRLALHVPALSAGDDAVASLEADLLLRNITLSHLRELAVRPCPAAPSHKAGA